MKLAEIEISYKTKIPASERHRITSSREAFDLFRKIWKDDKIELREEMKILFLNKANKVLGWITASTGGVSGCLCDTRTVFGVALKANASSIIMAHNHPSGNIKYSSEDLKLTEKFKEAGKILDIPLLDHLIITKEGYYSFQEDGLCSK